ncbi:hypothetical protein ACFY8X_27180 [Streptomyces tanashiensis]|uniref:hypothetical protein n=1 Tax=Streptomyces tanashiensis TaxID=67367 RepID=UPI0033D2A487
MTVQLPTFLIVLGMCLFSAVAGLIGFGVARLINAPVERAIGWGGLTALAVMTLSIAVLDVVVPLLA